MDYPCVKFGEFSFSRFGFILRTDRQNHIYKHTDAAKRFTPATVVIPLTSTWPHLNSDVGLEEGEY